jgi:hypothetical protein
MIIDIDKEGLISLVWGISPNYNEFNNEKLTSYGTYKPQMGKWEWDIEMLFTLEDETLYEMYTICRESWLVDVEPEDIKKHVIRDDSIPEFYNDVYTPKEVLFNVGYHDMGDDDLTLCVILTPIKFWDEKHCVHDGAPYAGVIRQKLIDCGVGGELMESIFEVPDEEASIESITKKLLEKGFIQNVEFDNFLKDE